MIIHKAPRKYLCSALAYFFELKLIPTGVV